MQFYLFFLLFYIFLEDMKRDLGSFHCPQLAGNLRLVCFQPFLKFYITQSSWTVFSSLKSEV